MHSLCTVSAFELARKIRAREVSSIQVVEAHIAQIEKVNPQLNAVVCDRFEQARIEARAADERLAAAGAGAAASGVGASSGATSAADLAPLHGVPCTIKECFALTGMPNTAGLVSRKGLLASQDATAVQRLRSAGAIPLGVTNTSELCMWMESSNRVYGRTASAYDVTRTAGGSSGGEGAIVGAGGSPFGLGSDIGGSIRMPAFFNGVFGHKPTGGMVPGTGQFPLAANEALRYLATGPIARRASDLMPLLRILAGPDGMDGGCSEWPLGDPTSVRAADLRVLDVRDSGILRVTDDLLAAQDRVSELLGRLGARVERVQIPLLKRAVEIWSAMIEAAGGPTFGELLGDGTPLRAYRELPRWLLGDSPHTLPAIALVGLERLSKLAGSRSRRLVEMGRELRKDIVSRLGTNGILLYPSHTRPAPKHNRPLWPPIAWAYTAILNVLEIPVTQVPLGLNAEGLPLGVQVGAVHGNDHLTIGVAEIIEREIGGWVPPARWS